MAASGRQGERFLIVGPVWVGDAVMMHSLLQRLKLDDPASHITVFAPPHVTPVLRRFAEIDELIPNDFAHGALRLADRWRLARSMAGRFDHALVLPTSFKSALIPFLAGVPRRTGYMREARYGLINDARPLNEKTMPRVVDHYDFLAEPRGVAFPRAALQPRLNVDQSERTTLLAELGLSEGGRAVALCIGGDGGAAKRWPAAHFAELARRLVEAGHQAWLVSAPEYREAGDEIVRLSGGAAVNLCGRTTLGEAIVLLSAAGAAVSNDTGLMHITAALGRPVVALYGPTAPNRIPPLSDRAAVVQEDLPCRPCYARECPLGHNNCMKQLAPSRVFEALRNLLSAVSSVTGPREGKLP
ncbi:MAG: lipopolysaccharide heptosyltransferase II [Caulobacterales bacterium]